MRQGLTDVIRGWDFWSLVNLLVKLESESNQQTSVQITSYPEEGGFVHITDEDGVFHVKSSTADAGSNRSLSSGCSF